MADRLESSGVSVTRYLPSADALIGFAENAYLAARDLSEGVVDGAILFDECGAGSALLASKLPNVYAVSANDAFTARMARETVGANALAIGTSVVGPAVAHEIVDVWLSSEGDEVAPAVREVELTHVKDSHVVAPKVITEEDVRRAIVERRSLIIGPETVITPAALALVQ